MTKITIFASALMDAKNLDESLLGCHAAAGIWERAGEDASTSDSGRRPDLSTSI